MQKHANLESKQEPGCYKRELTTASFILFSFITLSSNNVFIGLLPFLCLGELYHSCHSWIQQSQSQHYHAPVCRMN